MSLRHHRSLSGEHDSPVAAVPGASTSSGGAEASGALSWIGNDPDAFETFYRQQVLAVERFVARRVSEPHQVADLTAEVFLAAITSAAQYRPDRGTPSAWLFGIAHHVIADHRRRTARRLRLAERVSGQAVLDGCGEAAIERLTERIDAERRARPLLAVLATLPTTTREILLLVEVDDLTISEAAGVLEITPLAARVRLHRARRALAARLDAAEGDRPLDEGDRP